MTIWISRYVLRPRRRLNARAGMAVRRGALLRVDGGFADLHPWPELGDADLDAQLASIAAGAPTPLARRSLACATVDGEARAAARWLFEGAAIPRSHHLLLEGETADLDAIAAAGFRAIKIKAGSGAMALREPSSPLALRIDVNASLDARGLDAFLEGLTPSTRSRIEFIEDPLPADTAAWREARDRWGVAFAADRERPDASSWDVAIVKPARDDSSLAENAVAAGKAVAFTSAMDHPVGQLWAAWNAARFAGKHAVLDCGLLTHDVYETTDFSERLATENAVLVPPRGTGLGFDDLLEAQTWERLA